jgi:hypothetical protein
VNSVMVIQSWEKYQHYKDRSAPWVKLHREMLSSESWVLGTDASRVVQVASMMLAPRYNNRIPLNYELLKSVMALKCTEAQFNAAVDHLVRYEFLSVQQVTAVAKATEQDASNELASCSSEERENRGEGEGEKKPPNPLSGGMVSRETNSVERVFDHWRVTHKHPQAQLDPKRRKLITAALRTYDEATLCQSITGYLSSPHHMGQNERATVYDDIGLMLRDATHIDAGLKFYANPPRADLSAQTRRIIDQTEGWQPPELRRATN